MANPRSHIGLGHLAGSPEKGYHIPYIRQARHKEQETFQPQPEAAMRHGPEAARV